MIEIACTCDDLPAHSHVWIDGQHSMEVEYDLKIWVDWRAVARELACEEPLVPKPRTREDIIAAAKKVHDKICSCDPKYLMSCSWMAEAILAQGTSK